MLDRRLLFGKQATARVLLLDGSLTAINKLPAAAAKLYLEQRGQPLGRMRADGAFRRRISTTSNRLKREDFSKLASLLDLAGVLVRIPGTQFNTSLMLRAPFLVYHVSHAS